MSLQTRREYLRSMEGPALLIVTKQLYSPEMFYLKISKKFKDLDTLELIRKELECTETFSSILYEGIITLGGDGTVLSALAEFSTPPPLYAINYGTVGFLCPVPRNSVKEFVAYLKNNALKYEKRIRLKLSNGMYFLNEVVMTSMQRDLVTINLRVDNDNISLRADALVISTLSGSTAYNFSLGGPILLTDAVVITTVAPNNCNFRPLVVGLDSIITVSIDAREPIAIVDSVICKGSKFTVRYDGNQVAFGMLKSMTFSHHIGRLFYNVAEKKQV